MTQTIIDSSSAPSDDKRFPLGAILSVLAFSTATLALLLAVTSGGGATATPFDPPDVTLELTEFAIDPQPVVVPAGTTLVAVNTGAAEHNLAIRGTELRTVNFGSGDQAALDLGSLPPGDYEMWCEIAGHADAGMTGSLIIEESAFVATAADASAGPAGLASHGGDATDWQALDDAMTQSMLAFPAATEGVGNAQLEPTILDDGTKRFELTAAITEWEVAPGEIAEAWSYNGIVPGPWIRVDVGDTVEVVLTNELPMGTDIHWHGVRTPNAEDGVAPITQKLIEAGEVYTYRFVAEREAVGMYHAHHHAQMQVPNGLLGYFQIGDLPLPEGRTISGVTMPDTIEIAQEIPMVLNDAGEIGYSLNGKSFPATAPVVVDEGDWLLVHYLNEGLQIHPMHQHQFPQLVIAKDGIPLDQPYYADTVNVAPGERYSVLIHADEVGTWVWHCHILTHVENHEGMFGMVTAIVVQ